VTAVPEVPVVLNGEERSVAVGTTIAGLVAALGRSPRGMAVAVNEAVVPRSTWDEVEVRPGDRIELLNAAQGG
jgi:sulfur carrier protein